MVDLGANDDVGRGLAVLSDGRLVVSGGSGGDFALAYFNADGTADASVGTNGVVKVDLGDDLGFRAVADPQDRVLVSGRSDANFALLRFLPDGTLDPEFGDAATPGIVTSDFGGEDQAHDLVLQGDGKIVAVGCALDRISLARYLPATSDPNALLACVRNVAPAVTGQDQYVRAGEALTLEVAAFSDPGFTDAVAGTSETFTATVDWGDGTTSPGTVTVTRQGARTVTTLGVVNGTHTYAAAGVYTGTVTVADDDGGASPAPAVFTVQVENEELHHCVFRVPGEPGAQTTLAFDWNAREAGYNNEFGIFLVDNVLGKVGAKLPGDAGYWRDALTRQAGGGPGWRRVFSTTQTLGAHTEVTLPAGTLFSTYLVGNNTREAAVAQSGSSLPTSPPVWFCFDSLNSDGTRHLVRTDLADGRFQFEIEDLALTGSNYDGDFDDMVFTISVSGQQPAYAGQTKFIVVDQNVTDDDPADSSHVRYDAGGAVLQRTESAGANLLGVASRNGTTFWTVDGTSDVVSKLNWSGFASGWNGANIKLSPTTWTATASGNETFTGITTSGTKIWLVDDAGNRVLRYDNATSQGNGTSKASNASWNLNSANGSPDDLVTDDGTRFWVVDDAADKVFVYNATGGVLGSWALDPANGDASGVTLTPGDPMGNSGDLWVLDRADKLVYRYAGGRAFTGGSRTAADTMKLSVLNANPEGIADPPAFGDTAAPPSAPHLSDVTSAFDFGYGRTSFNAGDADLFADLSLTNAGLGRVDGSAAA